MINSFYLLSVPRAPSALDYLGHGWRNMRRRKSSECQKEINKDLFRRPRSLILFREIQFDFDRAAPFLFAIDERPEAEPIRAIGSGSGSNNSISWH